MTNDPTIFIRPAEKTDAKSIDILLSTYFLDREEMPYERFYVAEINDKVVGCAVFEKIRKPENAVCFFEIHTIAVLPPYKGKGIGKLLLKRACDEIADEITQMAGDACWPEIYVRTTAPDFFRHCGFEAAAVDKKKYWKECAKCGKIEICSQTVLVKK